MLTITNEQRERPKKHLKILTKSSIHFFKKYTETKFAKSSNTSTLHRNQFGQNLSTMIILAEEWNVVNKFTDFLVNHFFPSVSR